MAACLVDAAAAGYSATFPAADLVTFSAQGVGFLFDHSADMERASRTVAAWTHARNPATPRDRSRQAGFPLSSALAGAGYERGHLIAHASGGGLDANVFAQARHVNRGWSPAGRRYRQLERLAAANPGCLVFHRLIYGDGADVPDLTELTVVIDGRVHRDVLDNRPTVWRPSTAPLRRGQRFHQQVQTAFLLGLAGATARPEHHVKLSRVGRGRVDLHVVPDLDDERYAVVIEIKSTDWDALAGHRVRPNLRAHIRQLQAYLDRYLDDMDAAVGNDDSAAARGGGWDSVSGVLLYPRRPTSAARLQLIDDLTSREAIMVAWYDEADWTSPPGTTASPVQ
ncbi:MAG TPA: hypothetical protein VFC00_31085 [Micromonosporaceae bacterium]|nr:hypothetical protein [Micromonosporaceae bacterium]